MKMELTISSIIVPDVPNVNQDNLDGDSLGDACDLDIDGDGLDNSTEVSLGD